MVSSKVNEYFDFLDVVIEMVVPSTQQVTLTDRRRLWDSICRGDIFYGNIIGLPATRS